MLTILDAIKLSTEYLEKKGVESARLNVELMLADLLNCKRLDLYLSFERPLKDFETNKLREWIARRGKNEPLQYILGKADFYGLTFCVNSAVLIPRQETETLVELIINQNKSKAGLNILDIGTGTGNIPIVLAMHLNEATITSIDLSEDAIKVAKNNADLHNLADRINFINNDIFNIEYSKNCYDIIVSNPPYVSLSEYDNLQKEITDYEPKQAVTDFDDGFKYYEYIASKAKHWLKPKGQIYFEVGKDQYQKVMNFLLINDFVNVICSKDLLNIERVVIGQKI